jgi:predicted nucleic acid-binding protein
VADRTPIVVADASVLVKLARAHEPGAPEAAELLHKHAAGEVTLVLPVLAVQEAVSVAMRIGGIAAARGLWEAFLGAGIVLIEFDAPLAEATFATCEQHGCMLYDGVAPATAQLLGATLYSADRQAHGRVAGAVLIG